MLCRKSIMPWTVYIRRNDSTPLGALDAVQNTIRSRLEGTEFWRDPSGADKAKHMPEEHREQFAKLFSHLPADTRGLYESNNLSFEFFLGSSDVVNTITLDVRGNGNPIPILRELACDGDWIIEEPSAGILDLSADDSAEWERFVQYRESGVKEIKDRERNP